MYSKFCRSTKFIYQATNFRIDKIRLCSSQFINNHHYRQNDHPHLLLTNNNTKNSFSSLSSSIGSTNNYSSSSNRRSSSYHSSNGSGNHLKNFVIYGSVVSFIVYELNKNRSSLLLNRVQAKEVTVEKVTNNKQQDKCLDTQDELAKQYGKFDQKYRTITIEELNKHNCKENRIWVAFREGVYDITDFVDQHPGGLVILMGAGNRIDSFWSIYANHKTKQVLDILESYRIANIKPELNTLSAGGDDSNIYDPFSNDPKRNPMLKVHTKKPFNAETPSQLIGKDFLTPNEIFFVRSHLPVPEIDPNEYRLEVTGHGLDRTYEFTLDDLKKLPKHDLIVTIQCAGNRREEFKKYGEVKGLPWQKGAISNAKWTGVYLVDLLKSINCNMDDKNIQHIIAEGYDFDPASKPYSASVQSQLALDPNNHVLIAYAMNDQDIPRDHGFPVRFVVPGVVGARNVKWLAKINLSNEEADSHVQRSDYKSFTPDISMSNVDFKKGYSIQKLPVQSVICEPETNAKIPIEQVLANQRKIKLSGYACSSTNSIIRVDIAKHNLNNCRHHHHNDQLNWKSAKLFGEDEFKKKIDLDNQLRAGQITVDEHTKQCNQLATDLMKQDKYKSYAWTLWSIEIEFDENDLKKGNKLEFICKAIDSSYNSQPEDARHLLNFRGVLNNSWHRIEVEFV